MGNLEFKCSCCEHSIEVTADQIGYVVYCPNCMAELIVPDLDVPPPPPAVPEDLPQSPVPGLSSPFAEPTPSQIIYRDANGNPLIPDDVSRAVAGTDDEELSETKIALAETLKALQAHQKALADARKELAQKEKILSETQHHKTEENNVQETDSLPLDTDALPAGGLPTLEDVSSGQRSGEARLPETTQNLQPMMRNAEESATTEMPMDKAYQDAVFGGSDTEKLRSSVTNESMQFRPFFTPHGDFLPFSQEEISEALAAEDPSLFEAVQQIVPNPQCWSYSVFALILETHINMYLPELPETPMPTVFFRGGQKYFDELVTRQAEFLTCCRKIITILGERFEHAIQFHDVLGLAELVRDLDRPMKDLYKYMEGFQALALPKKEPFPELRDLFLEFYNEVRIGLLAVVDRLDQRSELSPFEAKKGTINVSVIPYTIHRFNLLLKTFPNV